MAILKPGQLSAYVPSEPAAPYHYIPARGNHAGMMQTQHPAQRVGLAAPASPIKRRWDLPAAVDNLPAPHRIVKRVFGFV